MPAHLGALLRHYGFSSKSHRALLLKKIHDSCILAARPIFFHEGLRKNFARLGRRSCKPIAAFQASGAEGAEPYAGSCRQVAANAPWVTAWRELD